MDYYALDYYQEPIIIMPTGVSMAEMKTPWRCICSALVVLAVLLLLHSFLSHREVRDKQLLHPLPTLLHTPEGELHSLAEAYCHQSLIKLVTGAEGSLSTQDGNRYELVQVHMLLRHGDRSPASNLQLKPAVRYECGMVDRDEQWKELQDFNRLPHPRTARVRHLHDPLFRGFEPQPCQPGRLTLVGFQQHRQIGAFMQHRYAELLKTVEGTKDVFVQSSDFKRTIDSAAAFLIGFLSKQPHLRKAIPIHISNSLHLPTPPPQLHTTYPRCRLLGAVWQTELAKQPNNDRDVLTFRQLATLLNIDYRNIGMTDLFDLVWCRMCHNLALPCGQQGCPSATFLLEGARAAHRAFNNMYSNKLSIVKTQAYLSNTVIGGMEQVVHSHSYIKLLLSFAHDSVLTPLLNSLGVGQQVWIPYASRIVMELWRDRNGPADDDNVYYVRLLLNGVSITHKLPGVPPTEFHANSQLISYAEWRRRLLTGPARELSSYKKICGTP